MKKSVIQWSIFVCMMTLGVSAFIVLIGEIDTSLSNTIILKGLSLITMLACVKIGYVLDKKGLLPEVKEV